MEDPIKIHVYAKPKANSINAKNLFVSSRSDLSRIEALKAFNHYRIKDAPVLLLHSIRWGDAPAMIQAHSRHYKDFAKCQEGYTPEQLLAQYCPEHDFYFAGVMGCHICSGFYE